MAEIIDGRAIAAEVRKDVETDVRCLAESHGVKTSLAVILVGDDPASKLYVSGKAKMCAKLGIASTVETLSADTSQADLIRIIERLNADASVHGILVQLPLPSHIHSQEIVNTIDPLKDVDGLHPFNVGLLCSGQPRFVPCTPFGVRELLIHSGISIPGREIVIVGRSNLVGRPLSVLLSLKGPHGDATVTIAHSRTPRLAEVCRRADVLIVAIGRPRFIAAEMIKPGAVVIDVGSHPPSDASGKSCGDVDFDSVSRIASKITPVPGGVGPMTIAMLMRNTVNAAAVQCGIDLDHA